MKKTLLACLLAVASTTANADWNAGLSYINLSDSDDGMDMSLGGIVGHASYDYAISDKFTLVLLIGTNMEPVHLHLMEPLYWQLMEPLHLHLIDPPD